MTDWNPCHEDYSDNRYLYVWENIELSKLVRVSKEPEGGGWTYNVKVEDGPGLFAAARDLDSERGAIEAAREYMKDAHGGSIACREAEKQRKGENQ